MTDELDPSVLRLFTSHYRAFQPEFGVPVQISNGKPKYELPYRLTYFAKVLYPEWSLVKNFGKTVSLAQFRERYWAGLDEIGVPQIVDVLHAIADAAGDDRLVLMCFEAKPADCHRGDFGLWWKRTTGNEVLEVPAPVNRRKATPPPVVPDTLW